MSAYKKKIYMQGDYIYAQVFNESRFVTKKTFYPSDAGFIKSVFRTNVENTEYLLKCAHIWADKIIVVLNNNENLISNAELGGSQTG